MTLETPVVFIIFARPEPTQRVFNAIAHARPKQLFVIADGPRNAEDEPLCEATRAIIDQVDWACDVRTNYSDKNVGLRARISSGLNWVFEQTETAIILEDDCLPHPTFFQFCETLLDYYRADERVMHISGDNFGYKRAKGVQDSYYFSRYAHVWGWATWRRAWQKYDVNMTDWHADQERVLAKLDRNVDRRYWKKQWDITYRKQNKTWAYQWLYACIKHDGLCVMPYENQISNIGMGSEGTNTKDSNSPLANLMTETIAFPLQHPDDVSPNIKGDEHIIRLAFVPSITVKRVLKKLKRILSKKG